MCEHLTCDQCMMRQKLAREAAPSLKPVFQTKQPEWSGAYGIIGNPAPESGPQHVGAVAVPLWESLYRASEAAYQQEKLTNTQLISDKVTLSHKLSAAIEEGRRHALWAMEAEEALAKAFSLKGLQPQQFALIQQCDSLTAELKKLNGDFMALESTHEKTLEDNARLRKELTALKLNIEAVLR